MCGLSFQRDERQGAVNASGRGKAGTGFRKGRGAFTLVELPVVSKCKRIAFTLVELLVVVAVIALLISILLPTLGRAKEQARIVKCLSNLKGLATACIEYTASNNQWYPPAATCGGLDWGMRRGNVDGPEYSWDTVIKPYYGNVEMLRCPTDYIDRRPYYNAHPSGWSQHGSTVPPDMRHPRSYGMNIYVSKMGPSKDGEAHGYWNGIPPYPWPGTVFKVSQVAKPSQTILFADCWEWYCWYNDYNPWPGIHGGYMASWTTAENLSSGRCPTNGHRNEDAANYVFCDGHATLLPKNYPNLSDNNDDSYWRGPYYWVLYGGP